MATRVVEIKFTGDEKGYQATIERIRTLNNRMTSEAQRGAAQASKSFDQWRGALFSLRNQFVGLLGVGALVAFARNISDVVGRIGDLSERTGIARQTLFAWRSTLEESGLQIEQFARTIQVAQSRLGDLEGRGKQSARALREMGLSAAELQTKNPEQFFLTVAQALARVENQNQRASIAMRIFNETAVEQIPAMLRLAEATERLKAAAPDDRYLKQLDEAGDAITGFMNKIRDLGTIVLGFLIEQFNATIEKIREFKAEMERFGLGFRGGAAGGGALGGGIGDLLGEGGGIVNPPGGGGPPILPGLPDPDTVQKREKELRDLIGQIKALELAGAQARAQQGDLTAGVKEASLALIEHEREAARLAATQKGVLTPEIAAAIDRIAELKIANVEAAEAEKQRERALESLKNALESSRTAEHAIIESRQRLSDHTRDLLQHEAALAELEASRLDALGLESAADKQRIVNTIELIERRRELIRTGQLHVENVEREFEILDRQQQIAELRLRRFGEVTLDLSQSISTAVGQAFEGVILGTSKLSDVGRNFLTAIGRDVVQFFTDALRQKLSFETAIFSNLRGFVPQAAAILGGGGTAGAATGGGGFGGGIFSGLFDAIKGLFDFEILGSSLGQLGLAGAGGGLLSKILGGSPLQHVLSSVGSIGGTLLGGTGIGQAILTTVFDALTAGGTSGLFGLSAGAIGGLLGDFLLPGIGSILGFLIGGLFKRIPNPSVWVESIITFYYDILAEAFGATTQTTLTKFKDISGGRAQQVAAEHQKILDTEAQRFVALLNLFPSYVHDEMEAQLDQANVFLRRMFGYKKYSEGGSRSIQDELNDLRNKEAPQGFFWSLRHVIIEGLEGVLNRTGLVGFDLAPLQNFPRDIPIGSRKDTKEFIDALGNIISFVSTLGRLGAPSLSIAEMRRRYLQENPDVAAAGVDPFRHYREFGRAEGRRLPGLGGVTAFLPEADLQRLEAELERVFRSRGKEFTRAADAFLERMKPLSEFLAESVKQASELFGRGLSAALQSATSSQGVRAFQQTLEQGTREVMLQGITQAFIGSAQFTDLLAPIQRAIREATATAIGEGKAPNADLLADVLLGNFDKVQGRIETLKPIIKALFDSFGGFFNQSQAQFEQMRDTLLNQIEEAEFSLETRGQSEDVRRRLEREREEDKLRERGFTEAQITEMRRLIEKLEELRRELENRNNTPVEITLQGGNPDEIARRLAELLSGRVSPN